MLPDRMASLRSMSNGLYENRDFQTKADKKHKLHIKNQVAEGVVDRMSDRIKIATLRLSPKAQAFRLLISLPTLLFYREPGITLRLLQQNAQLSEGTAKNREAVDTVRRGGTLKTPLHLLKRQRQCNLYLSYLPPSAPPTLHSPPLPLPSSAKASATPRLPAV